MDTSLHDTLGNMLRANVAKWPAADVIRFNGQSTSYRDFDAAVDRTARMLLALGIRHGDRVAGMLPNCPETLILDFACFRIGAIVVPINTRYQRDEACYALEHSGARLLVVDAAYLDVVEGLDRELLGLERLLIRNGSTSSDKDLDYLLNQVDDLSPVDDGAQADDPAVIFYTSGSTARPKGVVHSHRTLLGTARVQAATRNLHPGKRWLVSTGIGYVAGLAGGSIPCIFGGATILIEPDLAPVPLLRAIANERAEATLLLPTMLLDMLENPLAGELDLDSLTDCFVAGDECSHDLYRRFYARFGFDLAQALGMTECEGYLTNRPHGDNRPGSVGKPAQEVELRLTSENGAEVADGKLGEIRVRAPGVMVGYWHDPDATTVTLVDGWLRSGDVARRDADGFYWFVERRREIVIHDGSNIAPHEVEDVIDSHPAVAESCVVGVPDPRHGAILKAFVELEPNISAPTSEETIAAWARERLSAYKVPVLWEMLPHLPRTATGKIDRKALHMRAERTETEANSAKS